MVVTLCLRLGPKRRVTAKVGQLCGLQAVLVAELPWIGGISVVSARSSAQSFRLLAASLRLGGRGAAAGCRGAQGCRGFVASLRGRGRRSIRVRDRNLNALLPRHPLPLAHRPLLAGCPGDDCGGYRVAAVDALLLALLHKDGEQKRHPCVPDRHNPLHLAKNRTRRLTRAPRARVLTVPRPPSDAPGSGVAVR